ncbi:MAG: hypothetical protein ABW133_11730 [Polyangiaceae bacterium]
MAKSHSDPPPPPDGWRGPAVNGALDPSAAHGLSDLPFGAASGGGARFDWAMGSGAHVRTFHVTGPAAWALALAVMAIVATFFVFVIGVGSAVALGAGAVAALGIGGRAVRRRLSGGHRQLGSRQ